MSDMTRADRIIAELMNALDLIRRESERPEPRHHYIEGMALEAMEHCDAQRERNSDGYLVVRQ